MQAVQKQVFVGLKKVVSCRNDESKREIARMSKTRKTKVELPPCNKNAEKAMNIISHEKMLKA